MKQRDLIEFGVQLGRAVKNGSASYLATKILGLARTHHRLCEMQCNGEDGHSEFGSTAWADKKRDAIEGRIRALAKDAGCRAIFQGDPRGATVTLATGGQAEASVIAVPV